MRRQRIILSALFLFVSVFSNTVFGAEKARLTGPFDTIRDYLAALEARGKLLKIKEVDQDKYEGTAFIYRMLEKIGSDKAPAVEFQKVKINGRLMDGPVIGNTYCGWDAAAMMFGVEKITDDQGEMYRVVRDKLVNFVKENGGKWKRIKPVVVSDRNIPCKEVILKGDEADLLKFSWFKNNPGDAGQYINTGAVFMEDPELGRNVGTYRIQVKGKNKVGVNTEPGQHGWIFINKAKQKGEKSLPAAIVLGVDPIIFAMSSTKVAGLGEDELEFAGGLKGKPVELVKCETSNIMVPAKAEMVIEGDVITEVEDEGPYAEMYGYMGKKHQNWYMNVKAITHRKYPIIINDFTGVTHTTHMIPWQIDSYLKLKDNFPDLVDMYSPRETVGITILSINKRFPGQGMLAGQILLGISSGAKIAIVVDKDVDVTNITQVLHAVATRWQPYPASQIIERTFTRGVDPSISQRFITSKIVIDATKQLPQEGGPESWPDVTHTLFERLAPDAMGIVDKKWEEYWKEWKK